MRNNEAFPWALVVGNRGQAALSSLTENYMMLGDNVIADIHDMR